MEFYLDVFLWNVVLTGLFIIGTYSLAIGVKAKQSSFYYYTTFSYLLLIYVILRSPYFSEEFKNDLRDTDLNIFFWFIQVLYNSAYFLFFLTFLDVKKYLPKLARFIKWFIPAIVAVGLIIALVCLILSNNNIFRITFIFGYSPVISLLGFYVLYKLWEIPGKLKYFFFIGSGIYLISAITSLSLSISESFMNSTAFIAPMSVYYLGVFLEQLFFGFGLSQKVQLINDERINLAIENEEINKNMNAKLQIKLEKREKQIAKALEEVQEARVDKLKLNYEKEINELKLHSLRKQMNPHFIFNALNSIRSALIENNQNRAIHYLSQFSSLLRKVLDSSKNELIHLDQELNIIDKYVKVENSRFTDKIHYTRTELDKDIAQINIPPLVIQPLVENAIWHGLAPLNGKTKELIIYFDQQNNQLIVEDNGIGLKQAKIKDSKRKIKRDSLGINNIKERLIYFNREYDKNYSLTLKEKESKDGTKAILQF
jgi:sensor histidine kinase YesM